MMTISERKDKALAVLNALKSVNPNPKTELEYSTPFELLVAVMLSAQCTDKRVNQVTPALFKRFPDAIALATALESEIFAIIKSVSYPNNKTKHLIATSKLLVEKFNGEVPRTLEELETLPGVGRKTASVVVSVLYGLPAMPVDTHVFRVSNRLGLVEAKNTAQAEKQLLEIFEPAVLHDAHHLLILHGRYTCKAKNPHCQSCIISNECNFYRLI